jgi:hypothetical protein
LFLSALKQRGARQARRDFRHRVKTGLQVIGMNNLQTDFCAEVFLHGMVPRKKPQ